MNYQSEAFKKYIIDTIDTAIEYHHIKVFYQPIIRTLSHALCGMEAVARWDDPIYGLLEPTAFVETLEDAKEIYKLDCFMVEEICRTYQRLADNHLLMVPISFNLSRLDFLLCDIFTFIDTTVKTYKVPKEMIHIEITESMFVDETVYCFNDVIQKFHNAGYQVWMDDFGSGYSSFNVLKDYDIDVLKMDVGFLSTFTKKSKKILTSIIEMAKKINIQTLVEGVETQEQFQFLETIGCEKVQGYLFSRPVPYATCVETCLDKGYAIESQGWQQYYDKIGHINFISDNSLALIESKDDELSFSYMNDLYQKVFKSIGIETLEQAQNYINDRLYPSTEKYKELVEVMKEVNQEEELIYIENNNYIKLQLKLIAHHRNRTMFRAIFTNLSSDKDIQKINMMDSTLRTIYEIYHQVYIYHIDIDKIEALFKDHYFIHEHTYTESGQAFIDTYCDKMIYPEDAPRFKQFCDFSTLEYRLVHQNGSVTDYFRTFTVQNEYVWGIYTIVKVKDKPQYLFCARNSHLDNREVAQTLLTNLDMENNKTTMMGQEEITNEALWQNLKSGTPIKFFWKDKNRRFVGATQSFLRYYGLSSVDEIKGKTDEEMKWHIYERPYKNDEEDILKYGKSTYSVPGKCIIQGRIHNIMASKMPVYKNGKIVGLMGFFEDEDSYDQVNNQFHTMTYMDTDLDVFNQRGLMEACMAYTEHYQYDHKNFYLFYLSINRYDELYRAYGQDVCTKILQEVAKILKSVINIKGVVGHVVLDQFMILYQMDSKTEADQIKNKLEEALLNIHSVDGNAITIYVNIAYGSYAEKEDIENLFDSTRAQVV